MEGAWKPPQEGELWQMWSRLRVFLSAVFSARNVLWWFGAGVGRVSYCVLLPHSSPPA